MREFSTGATRDDDTTKADYRGYLSPQVLRRFGQYMTEHRTQADGTPRASDNWKKGIPRKEYLSSLLRHTVDLWYNLEHLTIGGEPQRIEDPLCAIIFNAQGLLHERLLGRDVGATPDPAREWVEGREVQVDTALTLEEWRRQLHPNCRGGTRCLACRREYLTYYLAHRTPGAAK